MQLNRSSRQNFPKVYAVLLNWLTNSCLEETFKRVNKITELQKSRVCKGQCTPSTRGGNRFFPYSREYRRSKGRGARTLTYTSQSSYQQPEVKKGKKPFLAGRKNLCLLLPSP